MQITSLTLLALFLNGALDAGKRPTFEEIYEEINEGTIFDYLDSNIDRIDLSYLKQVDRDELVQEWQGFANAVDARRKFAVEENGFCLLLAYIIEGIQQRAVKQEQK